MLGGDGFDDELAAGFWVDGDFGAVEGSVDQVEDFGIVEDGGRNEADVADDVAAAFQAAIGIREAGALEEAEGDVVGHEQDRQNCEQGFVGGAEADYEAVVIVVDHFGGARKELAHFRKGTASLGGDFWGVFGEEAGELLGWSGGAGHFRRDDSTDARGQEPRFALFPVPLRGFDFVSRLKP